MSAAAIFSRINFMLGLIAAMAVFCCRLPRRKFFILRAVLTCAALLAVALAWGDSYLSLPSAAARWVNVAKFMAQFVLVCLGAALCFDADLWSYLFCGTAAYCLQHISYQSYSILTVLIGATLPLHAQVVLLTLISGAIYTGGYFLLVKKRLNKGERIAVDSKMQTLVALIVLAVTVCISFFGAVYSFNYPWSTLNYMLIIICCFSIMSCMLGLCTEFGLFAVRKMESELSVVKRMLHSRKAQYEFSKETIDIINRKCHDLKHQLAAYAGKLAPDELKEIQNAVSFYDSAFKTENPALDVLLSEKSLHCLEEKIRLTCMLDGASLSGLSERDLYSLFGNALDNAIESAEKQPEEKRTVSISGHRSDRFYRVRIENYFSGSLEFSEGLPQTTKKNRFYHGFGMKSMKLLCEKYGGMISAQADGDVFVLEILLPLPKSESGALPNSAA